MQRELMERLQALPGVQSVSIANDAPVRGWFSGSREILPEGQEKPLAGQHMTVDYNEVTPHYFETLGVPLVSGRNFTEADKQDSPPVAIVSETMARRYWPGEDPIGKRFRIARFMNWSPYHEIVGIVKDTRYNRLEQKPAPHLYLPLSQNYNVDVAVHVRSSMDSQAMRETLRRQVSAIDPSLPPPSVRTFAEQLIERDSDQRMIAALVSLFGFLALVLTSTGVYALLSYSVAQRTREIGIRMALGANRWETFRLVVGQALFLGLQGIALGLAAALFVARIVASLLYGIRPSDPMTLVSASVLLTAVVLIAGSIPARRAMRGEPAAALRHE
jgi:putative ABC transport system permease protein